MGRIHSLGGRETRNGDIKGKDKWQLEEDRTLGSGSAEDQVSAGRVYISLLNCIKERGKNCGHLRSLSRKRIIIEEF